MFSSSLKFSFVLLLFCGTNALFAQSVQRGDSVQVILQQLSQLQNDFEIVKYIPESQRWCLSMAHDEVPENLLENLQDAFFYDIESYCKYYGWKYLVDWRVLASKAARESFWGTSFLSNRASNYFGIRASKKEWICESFGYCNGILKNDPEPSEFVVFPDFEASLWMLIHTMYSKHYLERLPDEGNRVADAIYYERENKAHYWKRTAAKSFSEKQLLGGIYTSEEIIYTWSEHAINNFCLNCNRKSDLIWVGKIDRAVERMGI